MKESIHPKYYQATVTCNCGNTFVTGSTKPEIHVEVSISSTRNTAIPSKINAVMRDKADQSALSFTLRESYIRQFSRCLYQERYFE